MISKDIDRATDHFLSASARIRNGLVTQRARIMQAAVEAPRLRSDGPNEYINLSETFANDVDYYVYEIGRARFIAVAMQRPFGYPKALEEAVDVFDEAIPHAKFIRDARTHPVDDDKLDDVVTSARPSGSRPSIPVASSAWLTRGSSTTTLLSLCLTSSTPSFARSCTSRSPKTLHFRSTSR